MVKTSIFIMAAAGVLSLGLSPAQGAVLSYNEAINGDLPTSVADASVLALGVGANTITGQMKFAVNSDFDSFRVQVADGERLDSIVVTIALGDTSASVIFDEVQYYLRDEFFNILGTEQRVFIPSTDASLFSSQLPFAGPEILGFDHILVTGGGGSGDGWYAFANYTFTLNVSAVAVPAPATLALFGLGLAGLGAVRRKKLAA
jgi:hypothetical protein